MPTNPVAERALPHPRMRWPALLVASACVLLLAPDARVAFGLCFLLGAALLTVTRVRSRPGPPLLVQSTRVLLLSLPLASFAVSAPASAQTPRYALGA